ncbi:unnamed protein product [Adineta ricciae]|uniref:EF-hand domain-containing protein n=1 Tax=Adineta ricciae TaxID=249248 RepID=A0A815FM78_ADIRI|nr:unnamed protein product [Adineta ricciae]
MGNEILQSHSATLGDGGQFLGFFAQKKKRLIDLEIAALKANSKLSEKEIREIYEEFQKSGGAGDGKISKDEFHRYYKKSAGCDDEDGILANNTFSAFDTNHDGHINFTEFVFAILAQSKTDMNSILDFSFEIMDTSGDGLISFDELKSYLEKATILAVGHEEASTIDTNRTAENIFQEFRLSRTQKMNKQQFIQG